MVSTTKKMPCHLSLLISNVSHANILSFAMKMQRKLRPLLQPLVRIAVSRLDLIDERADRHHHSLRQLHQHVVVHGAAGGDVGTAEAGLRNHMTGLDVQNSGSLTATVETSVGCCCCGGDLADMAVATAALMRALIAASNCASCSAFIMAWDGEGNNNNNGEELTGAPYICKQTTC
jgi:hypothetical protein